MRHKRMLSTVIEPAIAEKHTRKAGKEHECIECGAAILVGDEHTVYDHLIDGRWTHPRVCNRCEMVWGKVAEHVMPVSDCALGSLRGWAAEFDLIEDDTQTALRAYGERLAICTTQPMTKGSAHETA